MDDDEVVEGLFGLLELMGEVFGLIVVNDVDLMIVLVVVVDCSGMCMGWGCGYFDKIIGLMEKCLFVYVVIYDFEVFDEFL